MGHAHNVDWTVQDDDLVIGLGVKTGTELYFAHIHVDDPDEAVQEGLSSISLHEDFDLIGASLVTLTDNIDAIEGKFDLEHLYLNEREQADLVAWEKW